MLRIEKILLPLDFISLPLHLVHQTAALAHHFKAEIVLLHVVTDLSYPAGVFEDRNEQVAKDLLEEVIARAQRKLDTSLQDELKGLTIKRVMRRGDPAYEIVHAAHEESAGLVMIPASRGGAFQQFLLGSVTAKVLHHCGCPVWTGSHLEDGALRKFAVQNVICAVDFGEHSAHTVSWAAQMASDFNAKLILAHATPGVEIYGPGGSLIDNRMKTELESAAAEKMIQLQQEVGIQVETLIESGDAPAVLKRLAQQANADLMVLGTRPIGDRLRSGGYAIICESPIPVLSV
jgi:nucleotide-binding universal stress UspA family protein